ncbi:mycothiol transferase [Pseudonocardia sp. DLS-67]
MYAPAQHDEVTGLVNYIDEQLTAIRAAAFGLTEEQARATPCRSALSVGGIIKHATYVMRGALERLRTEVTEQPVDAAAYAAFTDSFAVRDDETVAGTIEEFDRVRAELRAAVAATDPAAGSTAPPAPWHGIFDARPIHARYYLVHLVEECARHAGHADIIREQIDGVAVPALVLTLAGASANDFFQPYRPAPGTLLALRTVG